MKKIEDYGFDKIGQYFVKDGIIQCKYDVKKTERLSLVYAMGIDSKIKYIGTTIQGYIRPLSYHKNDVMKDVKNGIAQACAQGKTVDVYARSINLMITMEDLELDVSQALEQALISKYKPEWNNHIR